MAMGQAKQHNVLRDAALLQLIAGELGEGRIPAPRRLAELAQAIDAVAAGMLFSRTSTVSV